MDNTIYSNSLGPSPFHEGEQIIQKKLGVRDKAEQIGRRFIRPFLPDQHRDFYSHLQYIMLGGVDLYGRAWASLIGGMPGFLSSPDARTLRIQGGLDSSDPLASGVRQGASLGLLGIDFATRRRNRVNGRIAESTDKEIVLAVDQTFGNCPKYIQPRLLDASLYPNTSSIQSFRQKSSLDANAVDLIRRADTFFVASAARANDDPSIQGMDVSHRGGQPGFVRVTENSLMVPDYAGNRYYNTLGNFLVNPIAGLCFIDFEEGDVLQLTGVVEILWDAVPPVEAEERVERAWRFHLKDGWMRKNALPLRWTISAGCDSPSP
ncbi:MAG: pyridoxamine 5'-phosphate oxidase family protein [Myxococcales bacterium]|nr:pyridoxamine 5'-phosphate oxidase family protein [Myxococcales bacterium]